MDIKINDEYLLAWWSFETTTRVLLTRFLSKGPHIYYAFEDYLAGVAIALREIDQVINREKRKKEITLSTQLLAKSLVVSIKMITFALAIELRLLL